MNNTNVELEKFFSYRLINVLYFLGLFLSIIFIVGLSYFFIPREYVNSEKSYITCAYQHKLAFIDADIYGSSYSKYFWQPGASILDSYDKGKAEKTCITAIRSILLNRKKPPTIYETRGYFPEYNGLSDDEIYKKYPFIEKVTSSDARVHFLAPIQGVNFYYNSGGSWKEPLRILIFGSLIAYSILNIIREALIYLFLGRKFTWGWLKFRKTYKVEQSRIP